MLLRESQLGSNNFALAALNYTLLGNHPAAKKTERGATQSLLGSETKPDLHKITDHMCVRRMHIERAEFEFIG